MAGYSEGVVERYVAITPNDDTVLTLRGFYVGGTGDVVITGLDGVAVTLKNVSAGSYFPFACSRIKAATTATYIIGLV